MAQLGKARKEQLKSLLRDIKRLEKRLGSLHKKNDYEDLGHGVLALQIAEHTVEETLEHTGLGGEIPRKPDIRAHNQAKQWQKTIRTVRSQGGRFLKSHPSEDLETALKALELAEGSLEEVAEHYE